MFMQFRAGLVRTAAASVFFVAAVATAQPFTEFAVGAGTIGGIAAGHDGNLWFTETAANRIGRITPTGIIDVFPISRPGASPGQITAGPDRNLWFIESGAIGRITVEGVVSEFPLTRINQSAVGIASGPDGNIWFTLEGGWVGRLSLDGLFTFFSTNYDQLSSITGGPDGNVWFLTNADQSKICRITPDGVITQFGNTYGTYGPLRGPQQITAGPDGNLWFTQALAPSIGRITTNGTITEYAIGTFASNIAAWNGELWLADWFSKKLLRLTTEGHVRGELALPSTTGAVTAMTVGSDGNLWVVEASGIIGRVAFPRRRAARH
jgi:virginiamycin B lyase